jgi:hypothetical protein
LASTIAEDYVYPTMVTMAIIRVIRGSS